MPNQIEFETQGHWDKEAELDEIINEWGKMGIISSVEFLTVVYDITVKVLGEDSKALPLVIRCVCGQFAGKVTEQEKEGLIRKVAELGWKYRNSAEFTMYLSDIVQYLTGQHPWYVTEDEREGWSSKEDVRRFYFS